MKRAWFIAALVALVALDPGFQRHRFALDLGGAPDPCRRVEP